ncbi:MAG TPA: glycoside hydrolase family 76 protein [Trebonia sp.]|nr:glycoside hydrolase family 76 protein [Trebonia sp.]
MMTGSTSPGGFQNGTLAHYATAAVASLQNWYDRKTGLWAIPGRGKLRGPGDPGWWNSANALHALIDYMSLTGTAGYLDVVQNTFDRHEDTRFLNDFYDDEGWWALAWISAHDLTRDQQRRGRYLTMATYLFADMASGWDERTTDGGVLWSKSTGGKNAIENELFLAVAARLYQRVPDGEREVYRQWIAQAGQWFHEKFIVADPRHLIYDGLTAEGSHEGHKQTWSYNQGVILGALADMADAGLDIAGHDPLPIARQIADAVLVSPVLVQEGVLTEFGSPDAGTSTDSPQFKGIFMRNLGYLAARVGPPGNADYVAFIRRNAASVLASNRNCITQFGYRWQGPFDGPDSVRQTSGLEAINAALRAGVGFL